MTPSKRHFAIAFILIGLAACQSGKKTAQDFAEFHTDEEPVRVLARITDSVAACWFGGERPAFAQYSYSPELTSYSDRPRLLIVPKSNPGGLPKLVIEGSKAERGTSVKLFGPLMGGTEAQAIGRDVGRWVSGGAGC